MKRTLAAIRLLLTLECDESTRLMSAAGDRALSGVERWALRLHFIGCHSCRRFRVQLNHLRQFARRRASPEIAEILGDQKLSAESRQRIAAALDEAPDHP